MAEKKTIEELLKQKANIEKLITQQEGDSMVNFSVDAGIINRLGKELVGRAETAVSELVKNAYDADARLVTLNFIDVEKKGGTLIIEDNGHGMTREQLIKGFMRLSSSDKVHHPVSPKYKRVKAGKKGIGRFATQRLGSFLTIITKTKNEKAQKIEIDWSKYEIDKDLNSIYNPINNINFEKENGTKLIIRKLNESWTEGQIIRVFRFVSELLQPDYLSDRSKEVNINGEKLKIASKKEGTFKVECYRTIKGKKEIVINEDKMLFNRSVAIMEGYIDEVGDGYCAVKSEKFNIDEYAIPIGSQQKQKEKYKNWLPLKNIYFKAYYFIYNRPNYYVSMTKTELKRINDLSKKSGSIRLYRNGFRVLPYGEPYDDWLKLDSQSRAMSGTTNIPFGNRNFFGFVQVIDTKGEVFEETASREGLIENDELDSLREFISKSLKKGRDFIREAITNTKKGKEKEDREEKWGNKDTDELIDELIDKVKTSTIGEKEDEKSQDKDGKEQETKNDKTFFTSRLEQVKKDYREKLEEIAMLRIWAGLGLSIGEFTHDVIQFTAALNGYLVALEEKLDGDGIETLDLMESVFKSFQAYIAFFDTGTSKAEIREIKPIRLEVIINKFIEIIGNENSSSGIKIYPPDYYGFGYTIPMHQSEWLSILFNLFSNAKKAIIRAGREGKIKIISGIEQGKIFIEFLDNGDGVPKKNEERIFNAFFSTSNPPSIDAEREQELTGRGLGLKLIKDTLNVYKGDIFLIEPSEEGYNTCFRIEIPKATQKQIEKLEND